MQSHKTQSVVQNAMRPTPSLPNTSRRERNAQWYGTRGPKDERWKSKDLSDEPPIYTSIKNYSSIQAKTLSYRHTLDKHIFMTHPYIIQHLCGTCCSVGIGLLFIPYARSVRISAPQSSQQTRTMKNAQPRRGVQAMCRAR